MTLNLRLLAKNFFALIMGTFVARLVNLVAFTVIARKLGAGPFGQISLALTVFTAFGMVANFGLDNLIVRKVARKSEDIRTFLGDVLIIKLLGIPLGIIFVLLMWLNDPTSFMVPALFLIYGLMNAQILFVNAVFRGLERMEAQTFLLSLHAILTAGAALLVLRVSHSPAAISLAYCVMSVVVGLVAWFILRSYGLKPIFRWSPKTCTQLLRTNLPFTLSLLGLLVFDRLTPILVSAFYGKVAVGWLNAAYLIIIALTNIPLITINAIFPLLARQTGSQDSDHKKKIYELLLRFVISLSFPIIAILFVLAPTIIHFLYGAEYEPAVDMLRILSTSLPFLFIVILLNGLLQSLDAQSQAASAFGYGLLIAIPLSLLLVWRGGLLPATFSFPLTGVLLSISLLRVATKKIGKIEYLKTFLMPIIAATAMFGLIFYLKPMPITTVLPLSFFLYLAILLLSGTIDLKLLTKNKG